MVRLTRNIVLQGISKVSIDKRDTLEIDKEFGRITHLHLQRKAITTLDSLHLFQSLSVLYLYENHISKIEGLESASNLEILHLQRNRLKRIENLLECKKLRKLYLGYNEIETVEGLHTLTKLEELHVENQRLQHGMSLTFDPKSLSTFCTSLVLLNISGNNITHFEDLAGMEELHTLLASNNSVQDLDSTSLVVRTLTNLRVLDLQDNPISRKPQFKERIIGFGNSIAILNDKEIPDTTRDFIQRFAAVKANRLQQTVQNFKRSSSRALNPGINQNEGDTDGLYYTSSASIGEQSPKYEYGDCRSSSPSFRMTPTKSNLSLNVPDEPFPFHCFPRRGPGDDDDPYQRFNREQYGYNKSGSIPQFILAPPPHFQNNGCNSGSNINVMRQTLSNSNSNSSQEHAVRKSILKKRTNTSIPTFKQRQQQHSGGNSNKDTEETAVDTNDEDRASERIFKTPKVKLSEMFKSRVNNSANNADPNQIQNPLQEQDKELKTQQRAVVRMIKAPMTLPLRCSRQSVQEGMPMPSTSMLHMADTTPTSRNYNYSQIRNQNARGPNSSHSHNNTPIRVKKATTGRKKMVHESLNQCEKPPFSTAIYELPPWPHISKIFSENVSQQPAVSFMP